MPFESTDPSRIEWAVNKYPTLKPTILPPIGEVTIVGTDHSATFKDFPEATKDFRRVVMGADYLLMEHDHKSIKTGTGYYSKNYEALAFTIFSSVKRTKDHIIPLESGIDYVELLRRHGLMPENFMIFSTIKHLAEEFEEARQKGNIIKISMALLDYQLNQYPGFEKVNPNQMQSRVRNLMAHIQNTNEIEGRTEIYRQIDLAAELITAYMAFLRDYYFIIPNTKHFVHALNGKKIVLVGKDHVPAVNCALDNLDVSAPQSWDDFLPRVERKYTSALDFIQTLETT